MAETIRRRLSAPDAYLDDRLEPAADCARRARCKAMLRAAYVGQSALLPEAAELTGLSIPTLHPLMTSPYFGTAWEAMEAAAPLLKRKPVSVQALEAEMASA
jgi:ABC-type sugar transport system substrate-binding protein